MADNLTIGKDSTIITCMRHEYLKEECSPDHKWWKNEKHERALGHKDFDGGVYRGKTLGQFRKDIQKFKQGKYGGCGFQVINLPNSIREGKWTMVVTTNNKIKKDRGKINDPRGVTAINGDVVIANEGNGNILQINIVKGESEIIGASKDVKSPRAIVVDYKNQIYFTDTFSKAVYRLIIGKPIEQLYKSPDLSIPHGITVGSKTVAKYR